jgi:GT2 family glycosyltransferase
LKNKAVKVMDLSIIILSYNTKDLLKECLISIKKEMKSKIKFEVIVVDNASTDGSVEMVRKIFKWVKLVISKNNLGYAGGNNLGLTIAKGKYIIFLNSDVEVKSNAFFKLVNFMEKDETIGAATPKVDLFLGGMDSDCHRGFPTPWASLTYFLGLEKLFPKSRVFGNYHKGYLDMEKPHEIDAGFGTFMIVRKEVIKQVGNWDDSYFFYGEDLDFFYRIKQAGWKVMFYPKALAYHHKGASSGLRKESRGITKANREITLKTAKASVKAWELFYKKFYKGKYSVFTTFIVLLGIRIKGWLRIIKIYLSRLTE